MKRPELQRETLHRLLEVSRKLSSTRNLNEILSVIIDAMRDLLEAERATVFEYDAGKNELVSSVAHGLMAVEGEVRFPADRGIAGSTAQTRAIVNVPDAYADERFNPEVDRRTGFRTRSILSIPLMDIDGELIGVAQVLNKEDGAFDARDEAVADALAAQAAVVLKQARLLEDQLARQRMERDLELARTIQQATFPRSVPQIARFDIAAWNRPADSTGGDVYDLVPLGAPNLVDDAEEFERAVLLLADATGHGIGPALHATGIRSMLRMACRLNAGLSQIVRHLNAQLCDDMPGGHFITAWLGMLENDPPHLLSFSAGHGPLLHYRASTRTVDEYDADTLPYGITESIEDVQPRRFDLEPGDLFVVMSDGFYESTNPREEQFGTERTIEFVRTNTDHDADVLITRLVREIESFCEGKPANDDRTIIVVRREA